MTHEERHPAQLVPGTGSDPDGRQLVPGEPAKKKGGGKAWKRRRI